MAHIMGIDSPRMSNINPVKLQQKLYFEDEEEVKEDENDTGTHLPFQIKNLDTGEVSHEDPFSKQFGIVTTVVLK